MMTAPVVWNDLPGGGLALVAGGLFLVLSLLTLAGVIIRKAVHKKWRATALAAAGFVATTVFWLLCTNRMLGAVGVVALYVFLLSAVLLGLTPLYNEVRRVYEGKQGSRADRRGAGLPGAAAQRQGERRAGARTGR